jgi:hypothetical protein
MKGMRKVRAKFIARQFRFGAAPVDQTKNCEKLF